MASWVSMMTPLFQECDASQLCPLTESREPDANLLVADLHSIDCLAAGIWPDQYVRVYPDFGHPLGHACARRQVPELFLNCVAYGTSHVTEAPQQMEGALRSQSRGEGQSDEDRLPQMPSNVLQECRVDKSMMDLFHHAETLVPEVWHIVKLELRILQALYFVMAILTGLGVHWGCKLRNMIVQEQNQMGGYGAYREPFGQAAYNQPFGQAPVNQPFGQAPYNQAFGQAAYNQPLLTNASNVQPWNPQRTAPQAPPQAPPQPIPADSFVVTCPEFTRPGQTIVVVNPATRQQVEVEVPDGVNPGQQFRVAV